jgi:putative Mn2+ efflux pump MntP
MSRRGPSSAPVGPIVLIVIGILFLLSNLDIIEFRRLIRFWPALLIVLGIYMLYERLAGARTNPAENQRNGK